VPCIRMVLKKTERPDLKVETVKFLRSARALCNLRTRSANCLAFFVLPDTVLLRSYRTQFFDLVALKLTTSEQRTHHLKARLHHLKAQTRLEALHTMGLSTWDKAFKATSPAPRRYGDQTQTSRQY
jgi:hypothetical protein